MYHRANARARAQRRPRSDRIDRGRMTNISSSRTVRARDRHLRAVFLACNDSDRFQAITRTNHRAWPRCIVKRPRFHFACIRARLISRPYFTRGYTLASTCTRNAVNKAFIVRAPSLPVQLASRDFSRDGRETGRKNRRASPRFGAPTFYFRPSRRSRISRSSGERSHLRTPLRTRTRDFTISDIETSRVREMSKSSPEIEELARTLLRSRKSPMQE